VSADAKDEALLRPLRPAFYAPGGPSDAVAAEWLGWLRRLAARTRADARPDDVRVACMNGANPRYVARNWLAQQAIDAAEQGDTRELETLLAVLRHPYEEQPGRERFGVQRPDWARDRPGCSALSCSS
jgi:serine/tyrosine/threonine adenylyltransferase